MNFDSNESQTTTIEEPTTAPPSKAPKTPRRSRPLLIILLIVVVALLAGSASVLGYKAFFEASTPAAQSITPTQKNQAVTSAAGLINALKPQLKSSAVSTKVTDDNTVLIAATDYGVTGAPISQPNGYNFYTTPATFANITVADANADKIQSDTNTVETYLASHQLTADTVNYSDQDGLLTAHFQNSSTVCTLTQTNNAIKQGGHQLTVNCADKSSYQTGAKQLQPVYDAYVKAKPDSSTPGLLFYGTIKDSKTAGYHTADIYTGNVFAPAGGSVALLYQTSDTAWHYFANTQNSLRCTDFNTKDLKNAYAGVSCYDATTDKQTHLGQ